MTVRTGVVVLAVVAMAAAASPAAAQAGPGASRIGDAGEPVAAAIAVSRAAFPQDGEASAAVLARPDVFADALAGAALAGRRAPILYPGGDSLRDDVAAELGRAVGPPAGEPCDGRAEVYLLGGTEAVDAGVEQDVLDLGYCTLRLAGATRVETAVAVAREVARSGPPRDVLLATAGDWPDSSRAARTPPPSAALPC